MEKCGVYVQSFLGGSLEINDACLAIILAGGDGTYSGGSPNVCPYMCAAAAEGEREEEEEVEEAGSRSQTSVVRTRGEAGFTPLHIIGSLTTCSRCCVIHGVA